MEREKQIKEMADMLRERCDHIPFEECKYKYNHDCDICWATCLVETGYRKDGTLIEEKTCVWEEWGDRDFDSIWICSNCKEEFCFTEGFVPKNKYDYCPHCGAKIVEFDELQEEEDD